MFTRVTGMSCAVCGTQVPLGAPMQWVCPGATPVDRHHVLGFHTEPAEIVATSSDNPFLSFRQQLGVDAFGAAIGLDEATRIEIIASLDTAVERIAGTGFRKTPLLRADALSDALGFSASGGVWVKDETHNVAGSHKARHIFTELIYLLMAEHAGLAPWRQISERPPLAIASCGNAAIAASTLARAVQWPIAVHVPVAAQESVLDALQTLDADVRVCQRRKSDPAGDPCVWRFRELVEQGALAFGVQGTENVWCLDGGRTLGWEIAEQMPDLDRMFLQVGGGAFASTCATSFYENGSNARLHAVQSEGCAPLVRAWQRFVEMGTPRDIAATWSEVMWPWESTPTSFADGILDDETYDWVDIVGHMRSSHGGAVRATESNIVRAHQLAHEFTDIDVSPTGSSGLAGVLEIRQDITDVEKVLVVFSGHSR
jgi:threonine synthase